MPNGTLMNMLQILMDKGLWDSEKILIRSAGLHLDENDEINFDYLTNKEAAIILSYGNRILEEIGQATIEENDNLFSSNKKSTFSKCVDLWGESEYNKDKPIRDIYYKDRYPAKSYSLHVKSPKIFSMQVIKTTNIVE